MTVYSSIFIKFKILYNNKNNNRLSEASTHLPCDLQFLQMSKKYVTFRDFSSKKANFP